MGARRLGLISIGVGALAGALAFLPGRDARASGVLTAGFGGDQASPAMPNGYAVYFNPAALGGTQGTTITGDLSILFHWAKYNREASALSPSDPAEKNDPTYVTSNTGSANLFNVFPSPYFGVNTDFGTKSLRAGYAFYIPFGGAEKWDSQQGLPGVPGTQDGPQRWAAISTNLLAIYNTLAVAYRIDAAHLSIGANVSPVIHTFSAVQARNADGSDDTLNAGHLVEGRSNVDASGFNIAAALGVYWEPSEKVQLGLSYSSQPGFGDTRLHGTLRSQIAETQPDSKSIDFIDALPDIIRLGGVYHPSAPLEIFGDVAYVRWSVLKSQCFVPRGDQCNVDANGKDLSNGVVILNLPRNWHDSIEAKGGAGYWLNDRMKLHGSLGISTPAIPTDRLDAAAIDALRIQGAVGVKYAFIPKKLYADLNYTEFHFFNVTTEVENNRNLVDPVSRSPSENGRYKQEVGALNLNLAYTF